MIQPLSVLLLDDDETVLYYLQRIIEKIAKKNNIEVSITVANDADEAWQATQYENMDGAIIDVFLQKGASGVEFAESWNVDNKDDRVAIHTGLSDYGNVRKLRESYRNVITKGSSTFEFEISCWLSGLAGLCGKLPIAT